MIDRRQFTTRTTRAAAFGGALALAVVLSGCAGIGDSAVSTAFVDPSRYDLYDCKQLDAERTSLAAQTKQLDALIAKAETGTAGPVVAEVAYRNNYISVRAYAKLADEVWARNKCDQAPAARPSLPPVGARAPLKSGGAVY